MSTKQHDETEVCDAGFTAADMATAAAQGFRDGQAAELAAMRAGGEPVAEMVPCHTPSGKRVAVISRFQHLPIGTKLYTNPQPAAQDVERLDHLQKTGSTIELIPGASNFYPMLFRVGGLHKSSNADVRLAIDAAIAAQQGDSNARAHQQMDAAAPAQSALHPITGEPIGTDAQEATAWQVKAENLERESRWRRTSTLPALGMMAGV